MKIGKIFSYILLGLFLVGFIYMARGLYYGTKTIYELLAENKQLKQAITNLTQSLLQLDLWKRQGTIN
jgi:ABC-type Na+ efflux pump permease subunit